MFDFERKIQFTEASSLLRCESLTESLKILKIRDELSDQNDGREVLRGWFSGCHLNKFKLIISPIRVLFMLL